jgi:transketolase
LGWNVISLEKGNDLKACADAINQALDLAQKNPKMPVAVHARTVKGIGTKKTAESSSGGHGFPLKSPKELSAFISEIYDGKPYPKEFDVWIEELIALENKIIASGKKDSGEKIQKGVSSAMIQCRKAGLPVLSITSDLPGSTGVADFRKEFPEASFDVGVAESNMVSTAAGLSKLGYIPVVDTFAQFGVTKGALPLTMASLSEAPIVGIFSHTGFQDAADGASHQALSYVAMLSSIPYVDVYNLSCSEEAHELVKQAIESFPVSCAKGETPRSKIFFLGRENFPKNYGATGFKLGQPQIVSENLKSKNVTIVASGSTVASAVAAAQTLDKEGIGCVVVNQSTLNSFQKEFFMNTLKKTQGNVVVVEDHQKIGGLGQALQAFWNENRIENRTVHLAVQGKFGQSAYTAEELYQKHGLSADHIVKATKQLLL